MRFEANVSGNERIQRELARLAANMNPERKNELMNKIGENYVDFVKTEVFDKQRSHQRKTWAELSPVTIRIKEKKGSRRGPGFIGTWTGDLVDSLTFRVVGDSVFIGSDVPYAPFFHFFVKKGRNKGGPWGDIPPRPFLGVSERADKRILKVMNKFFSTDIIK